MKESYLATYIQREITGIFYSVNIGDDFVYNSELLADRSRGMFKTRVRVLYITLDLRGALG